jgi:hypothetical protein
MNPEDMFIPDETPDGPDKAANEKKLNEKLQEYHRAFAQEFETSENYKEGNLPPTEIRDRTKALLTQATPKAVGQLLYLSQFAANESVRLKAAMFIVERAIGKEAGLVGDTMDAFLAGAAAARENSGSGKPAS